MTGRRNSSYLKVLVLQKLLPNSSSWNYKLLESQLKTLKVPGGAIATHDKGTDAYNFELKLNVVRQEIKQYYSFIPMSKSFHSLPGIALFS